MRRATWWTGVCLSMVLLSGLTTGCATRGPVPSTPQTSEALWNAYMDAVKATQYPQPVAISASLVPIVHSTPELKWNADGKVLMVAWTMGKYYQGKKKGDPYEFSHGQVWLTAVPFLKTFCHKVPKDNLTLRLQQVLGLPPATENVYDSFVEFWVAPADLFRPCADPEITDRECTLNLTTQPSPDGECPWKDSFQNQTSARWVSVQADHLTWMCDNWTKSFPAEPKDGFPWTALGYTYDWGQSGRHVGQSEFVAPKGTTAVIESITGTAEYCTSGI